MALISTTIALSDRVVIEPKVNVVPPAFEATAVAELVTSNGLPLAAQPLYATTTAVKVPPLVCEMAGSVSPLTARRQKTESIVLLPELVLASSVFQPVGALVLVASNVARM